MEMKKLLSKLLMKASETSITASKASVGSFGAEKMPESMKNKR